ncbi:MAG: histidine phosphatase family protein [Deltaproteobacteria bacterium]|nr:histidine phosphatase family protein [Deltaproteobacteria bacterium]
MGTLYLVRHGQASIHADDYDQLSALGERQAELLGRYWGTRDVRMTRAFVGPLKRQRGSFAALVAGYGAAGVAPFEAADDGGLAEFDALELLDAVLPTIADEDPVAAAMLREVPPGSTPARGHERLFRHVTTRWVKGELAPPGVRPFAGFRAQVREALARAVAGTGRDDTTVAVTSGGVIGAMVAEVVGADDLRALELAWIVRNASFTELAVGREGARLVAFNAVPHLDGDGLVTYR